MNLSGTRECDSLFRQEAATQLEPLQPQLWPYLQTLERLALALGVGLFVGLERQYRRKGAGLRTFAFGALLGALGGLLGQPYALASLGLLGLLMAMFNWSAIRAGQRAELTTSAAFLVTGYAGILCGLGHTLTPTAVAVGTAALLAWREPFAEWTGGLSETELRSAILLAVLAFVIYPALPAGDIDPWSLIAPRPAWATVILIAGLGFVNYVLLKRYGSRGVELTGFFGGLVNSTVTVTELATRDRDMNGGLSAAAYRGVLLATAAMVLRNTILLAFLSPASLVTCWIPLTLMLLASVGAAFSTPRHPTIPTDGDPPTLPLSSPFSATSALRFGILFLVLQVASTLAERGLGHVGVYAVSLLGGLISSASAVASAAALAARGTLDPAVAGLAAVLASVASALVNLPLVARLSHDRPLSTRLAWALALTVLLGALGWAGQNAVTRWRESPTHGSATAGSSPSAYASARFRSPMFTIVWARWDCASTSADCAVVTSTMLAKPT